ncbi:MAG: DUF4062 domain-containing protein, partial [bacterium]|nr:DUF4062 domain-containing protein [bacterium]
MSQTIRVFISSTYKDLIQEREAVEKALMRLNETIPVDMKYFGSKPETPLEVSLQQVAQSDVYVVIIAHRYGTIPDHEQKSITELEYDRAIALGKPAFIYFSAISRDDTPLKNVDTDPELEGNLIAFKERLQKNHTVANFNNPDELAVLVVTDITNQGLVGVVSETAESPYGFLRMYLEAVRDEHKWLRILALEREVEMDSLYIRLQLSQRFRSHQIERMLEQQEREELSAKKKQPGKLTSLDIQQAVEKYKRFVVIGYPGSGKTTSLRHLAYKHAGANLERLNKNQEPDWIPVYVQLGVHGDENKSLSDYIWDVVRSYSLPLSLAQNLEKHFQAGRVLLLIDGLDEVKTNSRLQVA